MAEWTHPFLEQRPYIRPSLNRARIVDLPGIHLPEEVRGKTGYRLLGSHYLRQRILLVFPELAQAPDLFRAFGRYLLEKDMRALAIGEQYGRSLGYLLLMLKRGDAINRVVRRDWHDVHWDFWAGISTIWLGGGLMAGQLGQITAVAAQDVLRRHDFVDVAVRRAPYAAQLPLVGVARTAPADAQAILVFDFGQTWLKRAVAVFEDGVLTALHSLPSLPARCTSIDQQMDRGVAERTAVSLVQAVAQSWAEAQAAGWHLSPYVAASIACYLVNGHPALEGDMDCYGRLQLLAPNLSRYLTEEVRKLVAAPLTLKLFHDGTAAALTYAGDAHTTVLTLGTAIGNGFPPEAAGLRPLDTARLMV